MHTIKCIIESKNNHTGDYTCTYWTENGPMLCFRYRPYNIKPTMAWSHHSNFRSHTGNDVLMQCWPNATYPTATIAQPANQLWYVGPTYPCYLGTALGPLYIAFHGGSKMASTLRKHRFAMKLLLVFVTISFVMHPGNPRPPLGSQRTWPCRSVCYTKDTSHLLKFRTYRPVKHIQTRETSVF